MASDKEIRQRLGWAEDQLINFIETAGGTPLTAPPSDSALYHIRTAIGSLTERIEGSEPAPEPEPTPEIPPAPTGVTAEEVERTDLEIVYLVDWPDVDGATQYKYTASLNSGVWSLASDPFTISQAEVRLPRQEADEQASVCIYAGNDAGWSDHDCATGLAVPAKLTSDPAPEPSPDPTPGVVKMFDPDLYTETAELLTIPDAQGVFDYRGNEEAPRGDGTGGFIRLDKNVGYPGGSQSMRYDYIDQEHNMPLHVGKNARLPEPTREVWVDFYARWSTNFFAMENFPAQEGQTGGNTFAHKFLFVDCIAPGGPNPWTTTDGQKVYRVSLLWPKGGSPDPSRGSPALFPPVTVEDGRFWQAAKHEDGSDFNYRETFDEQWHRLQLHVRADPGLMRLIVDGEEVINAGGFTIHPEVVFRGILPGRNKDDGLMQGTESLWWGRMEIGVGDPGW